jgi:signal transduction histidine kinase
MISSLRNRLLITYMLVTILVLAVVAVSLFFFVINNPFGQRLVYQRLDSVVARVQTASRQDLAESRVDQFISAVDRIDQRFDARILILDREGSIVADSRSEDGLASESLDPYPEGGEELQHSEFRDLSRQKWLSSSVPLSRGLTLVVAQPGPRLLFFGSLLDDVLRPVLQAALLGLLVSIALAWLVAKWVVAPLRRMGLAARAVAAGDYSRAIPIEGPDEVRGLGEAFDEMVRQLDASQSSQRDFVANVSHELRTPLTSIQGFAQAILDGAAAEPHAQKHAAEVIFNESDRLRRLVEDLLDLARIDSGQVVFQRVPVDLGLVIRGVEERLSLRAAEQQVEFINLISELPLITGDGDRLAQVFTNLMDNASKHSPPGAQVTLRSAIAAGWVLIHIDDQGGGIPEEDLSRIFERFYRVDRSRKSGHVQGAGLGLAISRQIVEAHFGRLEVQSRMGHGSRFTVSLPIIRHDDETVIYRKKH